MLHYQNRKEDFVPESDDQLMREMAENHREVFTSLYRRYWEELFITAVKAVRGKEDAADLVQEVLLFLWNRRYELNIQGSVAAYLHTSIRYKCIHYIEKNITRMDYLVQLADVKVSNLSTNPEIDLQLKEIQEMVSQTVAKNDFKNTGSLQVKPPGTFNLPQDFRVKGHFLRNRKKAYSDAFRLIK